MKKAIVAATTVALAAGIGLGITNLASAETPSPTPSPSASSDANKPGRGGEWGHRMGGEGRGRHGDRGQDLSALATKLGVDETKLADAVKKVRNDLKPSSTDRGKDRDQSRADWEAARAEREAAFAKALASELGIDQAKVSKALEELRTERQAERTAADKAVLDQAVKDGKLTQAEADAVAKAADLGIARVHR